MKVGDLVTVNPAAVGIYLIVGEQASPEGVYGAEDLVMLYGKSNDDWITLPMRKQFVKVIQSA